MAGAVAGTGNTIAFNHEGVELGDAATVGDAIEENSIFGNTGLGITLAAGLPNDGQPAPVLTSVVSTSTTTVTGSLTAPDGVYRLEFFASPNSGPAEQGETFLGSFPVTVSGSTAPFTATGLLALPANSYVTATATSSTGDTSQFGTLAAVGVATQLVVTQQPSATATAGVTFSKQPIVEEEDALGNVITTDSTSTVTVARGNHGTGALQGSSLTVTLVNGGHLHRGSSTMSLRSLNLSFSTTAGAFTATSNDIAVSPATASKFVVTQQPSTTATAGVAFATQPVVTEEDAFGNVIATDNITTVTATRGSLGNATLQGSNRTVTLVNGVGAFSGLSYNVAETINLRFFTNKAGVATATSNNIVVSPATATQLVFAQQPSSTGTGQAISPPVTIQLEDQFDNVETGDNTSSVTAVIASGPAGGSFTGGSTTTVTVQAGVATFRNLILSTVGAIDARGSDTSPVLTSAPSDSFVVGQPPVITSDPGTTFTAGTFGSFTVMTTGDPTPSLSESGSLPNDVTFVDNGNGTATLSGTPAFGTGGIYTITITASNSVSSIDQPFTLTVADPPPVVTTPTSGPPAPGNFTATLGGTVVSSDGGPSLERGIVYEKTTDNANPMIGGKNVTVVDDANQTLGAFAENIKNGLAPGTPAIHSWLLPPMPEALATAPFRPSRQPRRPLQAIFGPTTGGPGQTLTFTLLASDPVAGMQSGLFTFHIKWGDGTTSIANARSGATTTHIYANPGVYTIQITATDGRSNVLPVGTFTVTISRIVPGVFNNAFKSNGSVSTLSSTTIGNHAQGVDALFAGNDQDWLFAFVADLIFDKNGERGGL